MGFRTMTPPKEEGVSEDPYVAFEQTEEKYGCREIKIESEVKR